MSTLRIPLANDKGYALVDEDDYPLVSQYKWHIQHGPRTDYAMAGLYSNGRVVNIRMHRLIAGARPGQRIDHINRNGLDNRRLNLRNADQSQNAANQRTQRRTTSGYKGVTYHKGKGKWIARIGYRGSSIHLGSFLDAELAAKAYDERAIALFGEYAKTNF